MTCGRMTLPSLATAAATSAICSGVAWTSFWPIDAWARNGGSSVTTSVGQRDCTAPGRSMGTSWLKPKASAVAVMPGAWACSTPIWAKAVLHDSWRITNSVPPQEAPPKLPMGVPMPAAW